MESPLRSGPALGKSTSCGERVFHRVLVAEDAVDRREPGGSAGIPLHYGVVGLAALLQVGAVVPGQSHRVDDLLKQL